MTRKFLVSSLAAAAAAIVIPAQAQSARDSINIVGSSTVYPFTTTVAEQFGRAGKFKTPKVESTGTGGGIKLFCNGIGPQHPDVANASRRMNANELAMCQKNGVREVVEVKVGYDGIVLAQSKSGAALSITRREVYLALAKTVPDPANPNNLVPNPYTDTPYDFLRMMVASLQAEMSWREAPDVQAWLDGSRWLLACDGLLLGTPENFGYMVATALGENQGFSSARYFV